MSNVFKMYQLDKTSACNKRRNFKIQLNEKKQDHYFKAVAVKSAIKALIKGEKSFEEVKEDMQKEFDNIGYQIHEKSILLDDSLREIKRYVEWEKRPLIDAVSTNIDLYGKMEVETTPDYIVADANPVFVIEKETIKEGTKKKTVETEVQEADGTIEIIKIKTGKMKSKEDTENDLGLVAMLMYGRKFYKKGRLKIKASYYYMKRSDDSYGDKPHFDPFDEKQIKGISEVYEGKENESDEKYRVLVDEFVNGHDEVDCNPKDCENCILYAVCKGYTEAPVSIDREFKTKASDIVLNELQKEAVAY